MARIYQYVPMGMQHFENGWLPVSKEDEVLRFDFLMYIRSDIVPINSRVCLSVNGLQNTTTQSIDVKFADVFKCPDSQPAFLCSRTSLDSFIRPSQ